MLRFGPESIARSISVLLISASLCFGVVSCQIPTLQSEACSEARVVVREFYSYHFGNEMAYSAETLSARKRYLTDDFINRLSATEEGSDPFTTGDKDLPRAFRVGKCNEIAGDRQEFDVLLFWRDDTATEQKTIHVVAKNIAGEWKIDDVKKP